MDESGSNFQEALLSEANRVLRKPRALWRTRRSRILPIGELDVFRRAGHLQRFESPQAVLDEASQRTEVCASEDVWHFLHALWSLPAKYRDEANSLPGVRQWLRQILEPPTSPAVARQRDQFRRFVTAMRTYDQGQVFPMPAFKWEEVSSWRIFLLIFPESFRLLARLFSHPEFWSPSQRMAALLLASTLANSDDSVMEAKAANDLIRHWREEFDSPRVDTYSKYKLVQQYYFASAEAEGGNTQVERCLNFIVRNSGPDYSWNTRLNSEYYGDRSGVRKARAVVAKWQNPKPRDLKAMRVNELILGTIPQALIDESFRDSSALAEHGPTEGEQVLQRLGTM
jgi:hypothetical protein